MRKASIIAGIMGAVVCIVCVLLYASVVQGEAQAARAEALERYGGEQVSVLVATRDLYPGENVSSANASSQMWLSDLLPEGCVDSFDEITGKQLTSMVVKGEAISLKRFESSGTQLDVPQGSVALSVPAKDVQAVGGALVPGNLVDVYAVGASTTQIGSSIPVLATNADGGDGSKTTVSWVTLAVPLEQSQEFVAASQSMDIYFTLPSTVELQTEDS